MLKFVISTKLNYLIWFPCLTKAVHAIDSSVYGILVVHKFILWEGLFHNQPSPVHLFTIAMIKHFILKYITETTRSLHKIK